MARVTYFQTYEQANGVANKLRQQYPDTRIVRYERGYAVQYYRSGPYYPETPNPHSRFNPANH